MDIQDSQRIKEIRDNTAKIADALERLADGKEQVMTLKEYKQSIIEYMDFGIIHTDLQDAYSIGFRNGIKWCKSLIDGVEPIYDSITDTPQTESTGSPIGDYRDGVGAWQTDCGWK